MDYAYQKSLNNDDVGLSKFNATQLITCRVIEGFPKCLTASSSWGGLFFFHLNCNSCCRKFYLSFEILLCNLSRLVLWRVVEGSESRCRERNGNSHNKMDGKLVVFVDNINWEEAGKYLKWANLLKLASERTIHKENIENVMGRVWKLDEPATFWKVERYTLLVNFKSQKDRTKVLEGGQRSFEGGAILLQKWELRMIEEDFNNTKISIWVHLYRLSFELRSQKFAKELAELVGRV